MKKLVLFMLAVTTFLLAGCYTNAMRPAHPGAAWNGDDFHNQMVNTIVEPNSHLADQYRNNYKAPRKYRVTPQDQQKYHNLNSRISKRLENMQYQNNKTSTVPSVNHQNTTTTQPSTLTIPKSTNESTTGTSQTNTTQPATKPSSY